MAGKHGPLLAGVGTVHFRGTRVTADGDEPAVRAPRHVGETAELGFRTKTCRPSATSRTAPDEEAITASLVPSGENDSACAPRPRDLLDEPACADVDHPDQPPIIAGPGCGQKRSVGRERRALGAATIADDHLVLLTGDCVEEPERAVATSRRDDAPVRAVDRFVRVDRNGQGRATGGHVSQLDVPGPSTDGEHAATVGGPVDGTTGPDETALEAQLGDRIVQRLLDVPPHRTVIGTGSLERSEGEECAAFGVDVDVRHRPRRELADAGAPAFSVGAVPLPDCDQTGDDRGDDDDGAEHQQPAEPAVRSCVLDRSGLERPTLRPVVLLGHVEERLLEDGQLR